MRPIFLAALGLSALAITPFVTAAGCAAGGETNPSTDTTTSAGGAGTGSSSTSGTSTGKGGNGGDTSTGGTGGATNTGGTSTGGGGSGGTAPCVPEPEVCDGKDNNCDGKVDEDCLCKLGDTQDCYSGPPATQGVGECVHGTQVCDLAGAWGPCTGEVTPIDELCDGKDNDCNGTKDDGLGTTTCGLGACQVMVDNCVGGVTQTCVPGLPVPEKCNGVDDSCDGVVDEQCDCIDGNAQTCYTGPPSTLNVGECKPGTQICQGGKWGPCTGEVVPGQEVCNAKDDDCDGNLDDGLGTTVCGVGTCQVIQDNCVGGVVQTCVPGQPSAEICDGKDNDCNGQVDDAGTITCGLGACFNTVPKCANGLPNACNPLTPQIEVCDGIDNNCNGVIDDGDPGGGGACNTGLLGVCAPGVNHCIAGSVQCVQSNQPGVEVCDSKDNDCDGMVDEGNPGGGVNCSTGNQGVCAAGTTACQNGAVVCVQNVMSSNEVCDGFDNNCNGAADEGNPGGGLACDTTKLGVCAAGTTSCMSGAIVCNQNVPSSAETCDGLDNNCNGQADEGNPGGGVNCNTGLKGICAPGTTACQNGAIACNQNAQPTAEVCNNLDDNCDGQIDNGNPGGGVVCSTGLLGVCGAGTTACQNGSIVCNQNLQPSAEICDNKDNNCNGLVDDGNPGGGVACTTGNQGICAAGTTNCTNGSIVCNQNVQPVAELCNGLDDNCNGQVDDGNPGGNVACNTGNQGVCAAGHTNCQNGAIACLQNVQPSAEICDGFDNNCNGAADEGNPGGGLSCTVAGKQGVCSAGTTSCTSGMIVCNQNVQPSGEVCDGLDNNCNGMADEGNPGGGLSCNTGNPGVCAAGTTACTSGAIACNQNVQPSAEVCDGLDNNCNGMADEGNPGGGLPCNTNKLGVCAAGTTACQGGQIVCIQNVQPSAETCDGLDNDCNGLVDDGNPGGGVNCNTGKQGVCAAGTTACTGGSVVCNQNVQPSAEICDGLDNNCNGTADEGNPGGGVNCNTGKQGVCAAGTTACTGGSIACNQNVQPSSEICDGLDNNCNGSVDESVTQSCYTGPAGTNNIGACHGGTQTCTNGTFGACVGQVVPTSETCNNVDDNCNGTVDEGLTQACYTGPAGTAGVGICKGGTSTCAAGTFGACVGQVVPATETCNNLDDNCNGTIDEGVKTTYYLDSDADGFGNASVTTQACTLPAGYSSNPNDCNDNNAAIKPTAVEVCDGVDNNCNGQVDEGVKTTYYRDADGDSYGNPAVTTQACTQPAGYVSNNTDCNDSNAAIRPNATETCNSVDDNCNGQTDENVSLADSMPKSCNTASGLVLSVAPGAAGAKSVTGYIDATGDDWFQVNFSGVGGVGTYYHPKITLSSNPGTNFKIQVFSDCSTSAAGCTGDRDTFEMTYPDNPNGCNFSNGGYSCSNDTPFITTYYVRVRRVAGAPFYCSSYTVTASNL